jgi:Putative phage abortive infection protein
MTSTKTGTGLQKQKQEPRYALWFGVLAAAVLVIALVTPCLRGRGLSTQDGAYDAAEAIFSGLAFAGVVVTLLMQRRELKLQRKELVLQRKETDETQKILDKQSAALARQAFENTLFAQMRLLAQVRDAAIGNLNNGRFQGVELFGEIVRYMKNVAHDLDRGSSVGTIRFYEERYKLSWGAWTGHYFRLVYVILRYVDESEVGDKAGYARMLRAQLSGPELALLVYNAHSEHGLERMLPLCLKYRMFHNLRADQLAHEKHAHLIEG